MSIGPRLITVHASAGYTFSGMIHDRPRAFTHAQAGNLLIAVVPASVVAWLHWRLPRQKNVPSQRFTIVDHSDTVDPATVTQEALDAALVLYADGGQFSDDIGYALVVAAQVVA